MYSTVVFLLLFVGAFGDFLQPVLNLATMTHEDIPEELVVPQEIAPHILGGTDASLDEVPYLAWLSNSLGSHICGGSIISANWVLTAAHCVDGETELSLRVVVGTTNRVVGGETYRVDRIIIHEAFDSLTKANDIGLVRVKPNMKFSDRVQPIALPSEDTGAGADLFLSGWRTLSLQTISLTSLSVEQCQSVYNNIKPVYSSQICAITKAEESACHGDSGGPVAANGMVVGVHSFGIGCGLVELPVVATRVYYFSRWIKSKIQLDDPNL